MSEDKTLDKKTNNNLQKDSENYSLDETRRISFNISNEVFNFKVRQKFLNDQDLKQLLEFKNPDKLDKNKNISFEEGEMAFNFLKKIKKLKSKVNGNDDKYNDLTCEEMLALIIEYNLDKNNTDIIENGVILSKFELHYSGGKKKQHKSKRRTKKQNKKY
jgi:hypothetical protein